MQNIELKAKTGSYEAALEVVSKMRAKDRGVLEQTDTYFHARFGRLKLREIRGAETKNELIAYHRSDRPEARGSDYELVEIPDAEALKRALGRTLGVQAIVQKERHLWIWKNVRIHLDRVEHLGDYIEFEAVLKNPDQADQGRKDLANLCKRFGIEPGHVESVSYADLLTQRSR